MSEYTKSDAARDTNSSTREVSSAWHDARDHAQKSGELPERAAHKASSSNNSSSNSSSSHSSSGGSSSGK